MYQLSLNSAKLTSSTPAFIIYKNLFVRYRDINFCPFLWYKNFFSLFESDQIQIPLIQKHSF